MSIEKNNFHHKIKINLYKNYNKNDKIVKALKKIASKELRATLFI
jgi:hypothetical protein